MDLMPFTTAVDRFLAAPKQATGSFEWQPAPKPPDQSGFWNLVVGGKVSPHKIRIVARLGMPARCFCVMVLFEWMTELVPITRLNVDPEQQEHINRPPRPPGVPGLITGCREFPWRLNRGTFSPHMRHLPFAIPLAEEHHHFHAAIAYHTAAAGIDLSAVALPDYPRREGLF
ncbi:hypothetical protein [Roseococcus sp. YIM B11640]|uniref:hypothetical protein n=1 Tax=Roseococcus sp. YIM B11640 TaxID=3133973 RepID=UPI003C7E5F32